MENKNNDIVVNCEKENNYSQNFSKRFNILLIVGMILTFTSPFALVEWLVNYQSHINRLGISLYLFNITYFLKLSVCFIGLLIIKVTKKPFPKVLMYCAFVLGVILIVLACLMFLVPNYTTGYLILSGNGFFIDGNYLSQGIIMIIISKLIKYGFNYQSNDDMTI